MICRISNLGSPGKSKPRDGGLGPEGRLHATDTALDIVSQPDQPVVGPTPGDDSYAPDLAGTTSHAGGLGDSSRCGISDPSGFGDSGCDCQPNAGGLRVSLASRYS